VLSKGARTVFAESVEIVADVLGRDVVDAASDGPSDGTAEDFSCAGLVVSEGLVWGDLFDDICSCLLTKASLILRRITSSPCVSWASTVVTCVCTPIDRVVEEVSLAFRDGLGLGSSLVGSIVARTLGEVGVPWLPVVSLEARFFCSGGREDLVDFMLVADRRWTTPESAACSIGLIHA